MFSDTIDTDIVTHKDRYTLSKKGDALELGIWLDENRYDPAAEVSVGNFE